MELLKFYKTLPLSPLSGGEGKEGDRRGMSWFINQMLCFFVIVREKQKLPWAVLKKKKWLLV